MSLPDTMEIHPLRTEAELAQALSLTAAAWHDAFDHVLSPAELDAIEASTTSDVDAKFENLQNAPDTVVLVAERDEAVVGWLSTTWHPDRIKEYAAEGEADIRTLYVAPDEQGAGVGTALLESGLERLPASIDRVVLETFRANERGRSFYESRGFTVRETTEHEVGENSYPSVVLEREL